MSSSENDRTVLRHLAERLARIAAMPGHQYTIGQWKRLNQLQPAKPMVWIDAVCWDELDDPTLRCQCDEPLLRGAELEMRRTIYQWDHFPVDMVVEDVLWCPLAVRDSGVGISEDAAAQADPIRVEKELERIAAPVVTHDRAASERRIELLAEAVGDILAVRPRGVAGACFSPWEELIRWRGTRERAQGLLDRPELLHRVMDRLTNACLSRLDQWESLGLLSLNNGNVRIGSGGLGYTDELPAPGYLPVQIRARDLWGCVAGGPFPGITPEMHAEFALPYEQRWLERFGLGCCCEPSDLCPGISKALPNLRRISIGEGVDIGNAAATIKDRCVLSCQLSSAVLAAPDWNVAKAEQELREVLDRTRGCALEVVLQDIRTIRRTPQRLWEWARMAERVTAEYA